MDPSTKSPACLYNKVRQGAPGRQSSPPYHLLKDGQNAEKVPVSEAASGSRGAGKGTISKPPSVNSAADTQKSQSAQVSSHTHSKSLLWTANLRSAAATKV